MTNPFEATIYKGAWHVFDRVTHVYYRVYGGAKKAHAKADELNRAEK